MLSDEQVRALEARLSSDAEFRARFEQDPVVALREAGMGEAAEGLEAELSRLRELGERISTDDAFREQVAADPVAALAGEGLDEAEVEAFLRSIDGTPEAVLDRATADVEAHGIKTITPTARLVVLLAATGALAASVGMGSWSDARLKEQVEPVSDALARLASL